MGGIDGSDHIVYDVASMREIGIRRLKASLSEVLRSVQAGESIRVTSHGKHVADIVPPRRQSYDERMDELAAQGLVMRAAGKGPLPPPPPMVELRPGGISAADAIVAAREDDRG